MYAPKWTSTAGSTLSSTAQTQVLHSSLQAHRLTVRLGGQAASSHTFLVVAVEVALTGSRAAPPATWAAVEPKCFLHS